MAPLIPPAALESHIGILGKTGSGKSNFAKVIAEKLMHAGERVCVIDPTGTWWGLRLNPDGKPSRFKPVIFGGEHADIPMTDQHGGVIAEAIGTSSDSAIIDTRLMTVGQRTRFFAAFAETILRTNRGPLHIIVDEAHLFAPQGKVNDPQSGAMLHAANNMVSLGRGIGLRIILISQRPAKLHKDSLTQVETLIAMRLIAPQDRAAVSDWIGEWADPAKGKEIIASLPSLAVGDAWVWSPQIEYLERQHAPLAVTYDSGKAPSRDEVAPTLAPIDAAKLGGKMDAIRQEAMDNSPSRLKQRIAELEREKAKAPAAVAADPAKLNAEFQRGYDEGFGDGSASGAKGEAERLGKIVLDFAGAFALAAGDAKPARVPPPRAATPPAAKSPVSRVTPPAGAPRPPVASGDFTGPQMKILRSLSMWAALGHAEPTKIMVAAVAGYSPSSGGYANLLGQLRAAGAIEYPQPGRVKLQGDPMPMSVEEGRNLLLSTMTNPQRKLFDVLTHGELSKHELAEATDYSATSGGFANLLGQLRSMGLATYPLPGRVALEPWVFEVLS